MAGFKAKLSAFEKKAMVRLDQVRRASIVEFFSLVIDATPVDEGFLKGGWQVTLHAPSGQLLKRTDPAGISAKAQMMQHLGTVRDVVWMTNTMPYAYRIEFDGWSQQAPHGMVRSNLPRWKAIVQAKAKAFSD